MAKKFLTSLKLVNINSDPVSASNGDVYYNSSANRAKIYQNGQWITLPTFFNDLPEINVSGASNGQVLTYSGTSSRWEGKTVPPSATSVGEEFPLTPSQGEFFFNSTTEKLYFFYQTWNEIAFTSIALDGGTSFTIDFDGTFDGGNSSTTSFSDGVYSGGDSSTTY